MITYLLICPVYKSCFQSSFSFNLFFCLIVNYCSNLTMRTKLVHNHPFSFLSEYEFNLDIVRVRTQRFINVLPENSGLHDAKGVNGYLFNNWDMGVQ